MRNNRKDPAQLLRWYPRSWRQRYGVEFIELIKDSLEGRPPTRRFRLSVSFAGILERGHTGGIIGKGAKAADRVRAGSLLVLCSWAAFLFAGASFAKLSERFSTTVPQNSHVLIGSIYRLTVLLGIASAVPVLTGATIAVPSFIAFVKNGGWKTLKVHVARAVLITALLVCATAALSFWAQHLSQYQRNGGDWYYSLTFLGWSLLLAIVLAAWTRAVVGTVAQISLSARTLRLEGIFAEAVAILIIAATLSTAAWWTAMGIYAPQFFHAKGSSAAASPIDQHLIITMTLMLATVVVSGYGTLRIRHAAKMVTAS